MYAFLLEEMEDFIADYIIDRGYIYFEDGQVEDLEIHEDKAYAFVTGNKRNYEVTIDLNKFLMSTCECPYNDYCKHMAAVVYALQYVGVDSVTERLQGLEKEELIDMMRVLLEKHPKNISAIEKVLEEMGKA
ncbi:SWIM zinc finger domain-containing protein [Bacillus manliponensis]|uniref:SWIM zinc finger family protein n=1 Tax=Bacillus manliponensis TaxID=574376 RepID=UPI0035150955